MKTIEETAEKLTIQTSLVQDETDFTEELMFGEPTPDSHRLGEHDMIDFLRNVVVGETFAIVNEADAGVDTYHPEARAIVDAAGVFFSNARGIASTVHGRTHFGETDHVTVTLVPE